MRGFPKVSWVFKGSLAPPCLGRNLRKILPIGESHPSLVVHMIEVQLPG